MQLLELTLQGSSKWREGKQKKLASLTSPMAVVAVCQNMSYMSLGSIRSIKSCHHCAMYRKCFSARGCFLIGPPTTPRVFLVSLHHRLLERLWFHRWPGSSMEAWEPLSSSCLVSWAPSPHHSSSLASWQKQWQMELWMNMWILDTHQLNSCDCVEEKSMFTHWKLQTLQEKYQLQT